MKAHMTGRVIGTALVTGMMLLGTSAESDIFKGSSWDGSLRCGAAVDTHLREMGLSLKQMQDVRWHTDTFAREGDVGQLSGFRFLGRPPSCAEGALSIAMWPNCRIQETRIRGGCDVAVLDH